MKPICISRYYRRERLDLECEIITPMFLGNACQEAELRAVGFSLGRNPIVRFNEVIL